MNRDFWRSKKVFLTGHTGFKGGWLALWLTDMGADVHGFALSAPTEPSFHSVCNLESRINTSTTADVRDAGALLRAMQDIRPHIVLHLAAQSLVRYSYSEPVETYSVNVMGTINVLEAARQTDSVKAIINVTSDKCYENREWIWPYRENEMMGGADPYSSSKACSELVTAAYRRSFLEVSGVHLASARAGNVIGGGDWATDRLIPDILRAMDDRVPLILRSPHAIRPWQHVLEPLSGYLMLAEKLYTDGKIFAEGWNFGPNENDTKPVRWIVEHLSAKAPNVSWQYSDVQQPHEANILKLDSSKSRSKLGWSPRWNLRTALDQTLNWHLAWKQRVDMAEFSLSQIRAYAASSTEHDQSLFCS